MAYWEWGDPANDRVLMCVHGLSRTGRDFDRLAQRLCDRYRVICPDIVGRGQSDWLSEPAYYMIPQYLADIVTLLARAQARELHWVGTSMGGLIGIMLAGLPGGSHGSEQRPAPDSLPPIGRMVLNDIGPHVPTAALERIGQYVNDPTDFASFEDAVAYIRTVSAPFGPHTEAEWEHLTRFVVKEENGRWVKHYDPGIGRPFAHIDPRATAGGEAVLWRSFERVACPTLLLRGRESDVLTADTAQEMMRRNGNVRLREFEGVGHTPTLMHDEQIDIVAEFLAGAA